MDSEIVGQLSGESACFFVALLVSYLMLIWLIIRIINF
jgi:hypothetical protein